MTRVIGIVLALLLACLALPVVTLWATHDLVPILLKVLVLLFVVRLFWPTSRRRNQRSRRN
jgi:uncharacterized protein YacL